MKRFFIIILLVTVDCAWGADPIAFVWSYSEEEQAKIEKFMFVQDNGDNVIMPKINADARRLVYTPTDREAQYDHIYGLFACDKNECSLVSEMIFVKGGALVPVTNVTVTDVTK